MIGSSVIQGLRTKHSDLSARLAELQTIYGENHPQIVATRAEIARVEERLRSEVGNVLAGLRNELESAEMNEAALRHELATVRQEMFELDQAEAWVRIHPMIVDFVSADAIAALNPAEPTQEAGHVS